MKTKFTLITLMLMVLFIGCSGNNSNPLGACNEAEWGQQISDELTAVSEASSEYSQDQTLQKCEAYKDALTGYLNALKGISPACIPTASEQDYQESIAEAEQDIEDIDCAKETGS